MNATGNPSSPAPPEGGPNPSGAESGGTGPTTTFFQVAANGQRVVYVIDRSMSMGLEGRLAAAKRELITSLEQLPATAWFQVIVYNTAVEVLPIDGRTGLVRATAANKSQAAQLLRDRFPDGSTRHLPALKQALAMQPDVLFFLTDADELKAEEVREVTAINHRLNDGKTAINTIELSTENRGRPDMPMQVLARENRGVYQAVGLEGGR
jgi:hypothetical protein